MLQGDQLRLRTIRQADLDDLLTKLSAVEHRGHWFPRNLTSEPRLERRFTETGLWSDDEGMLVMVDADDTIVGEIEYYPLLDYLTGYELSYLVFDPQHRGKGYAAEAVRLLTAYLFDQRRVERVQLAIHPDNDASRRVAVKAGYTLEGTMRRCWFQHGTFQDLELWSILRDEVPEAAGP